MGSQCHITKTLQDTLNPKWNSNCQFFIKDLEQDVLCVTVFERDQFSPDGQNTHTYSTPEHTQDLNTLSDAHTPPEHTL